MSEQLDLTTPIATPARTFYMVQRLVLDWGNQIIQVTVRGSDNVDVHSQWEGATAVTLMRALNKANLTANSLHKRVITQLIADGFLPAGTISGTPD
jgi:hypothetical protein